MTDLKGKAEDAARLKDLVLIAFGLVGLGATGFAVFQSYFGLPDSVRRIEKRVLMLETDMRSVIKVNDEVRLQHEPSKDDMFVAPADRATAGGDYFVMLKEGNNTSRWKLVK